MMNKKAYTSPELVIVHVEPQSMLAASGDNKTFSVSNDEVTEGWADSRSGNVWDDED